MLSSRWHASTSGRPQQMCWKSEPSCSGPWTSRAALGYALWKLNHDMNNSGVREQDPDPRRADKEQWAEFEAQFEEMHGLRTYEFDEFPGRARPAVALRVVGCYRFQTESSDERVDNLWPERIFD